MSPPAVPGVKYPTGPGQHDSCTLSCHGLDSVSVSSPVFLTLFFAGCGGSPFLHLSLHLSLSFSLLSAV